MKVLWGSAMCYRHARALGCPGELVRFGQALGEWTCGRSMLWVLADERIGVSFWKGVRVRGGNNNLSALGALGAIILRRGA